MSKDTEKVYSILEVCVVSMKTWMPTPGLRHDVKQESCRVNPDVEWAYFYLGVGSFLNADLSNAQNTFPSP